MHKRYLFLTPVTVLVCLFAGTVAACRLPDAAAGDDEVILFCFMFYCWLLIYVITEVKWRQPIKLKLPARKTLRFWRHHFRIRQAHRLWTMKVVALVSGGKDSCYAMMKCIQYGHEVLTLLYLSPLSLYMYLVFVWSWHRVLIRRLFITADFR